VLKPSERWKLDYIRLKTKEKQLEKFSFNKEWYKSARLRVLLVTAALLVANDMFGVGIPEGTVDMIAGLALAYIGGKSIQDTFAAYAEVKGKAIAESAKLDPKQPG